MYPRRRLAHAALACVAVAACEPGARRLSFEGASAEARVVAVTLDVDLAPLSVHGPLRLDEASSFDLPAGAAALVGFALEPSALLDLDGERLSDEAWSGLTVARGTDTPGCGRCTAPRAAPPQVVAPGDECPAPEFAEASARAIADADAAIDPTAIAAARSALVLRWAGPCALPWAPLADARAPIEPSCPWLPVDDPLATEELADAPDGEVIALSDSGVWWASEGADGAQRRGFVDLGEARVRSAAPVPAGGWLVASEAPVGSRPRTLHRLDRDLTLRATVRPVGLAAHRLRTLTTPRGPEVWALGAIRDNFTDVPVAARCDVADDDAQCSPDVRIDDRCLRGEDAARELLLMGGRYVLLSGRGIVLAARAAEPKVLRCVGALDHRFPVRDSARQGLLDRIDEAYASDTRLWACGGDGAQSWLFTLPLPPAPAGDPDFEAVIAAAAGELIAVDGGTCAGFVTTASGAVALIGARRYAVHDDGTVTAASEDIAPGAVSARVGLGGRSLWIDGARRAYRADARGGGQRLFGSLGQPDDLVELAAIDGGFLAWRERGAPLAIPVPTPCAGAATAAPRALAGLEAVGPLRAWRSGEHGTWALTADGSPRLVSMDARTEQVRAWSLTPPLDTAPLLPPVALTPSLLVLASEGGALYRARLTGDTAELEPVRLEPWGDADRAPSDDPPWRALAAAGGVAWAAGDGALARVTAVSADILSPSRWPLSSTSPLRPRSSGYAGLVVLGPSDVLASTRDSFSDGFITFTRVATHHLASSRRGCAGVELGAGLRVCRLPDGADDHTLTADRYAPRLGVGPGRDPLLVNGQGLIYGPDGIRGGVGFDDPRAIAQDARGVVAVLGEDGHLWLGARR